MVSSLTVFAFAITFGCVGTIRSGTVGEAVEGVATADDVTLDAPEGTVRLASKLFTTN